RNGNLDSGRNVDVLLTRGSLDRLDRRRERCDNTRRAVAVAQAAHFNVSGGYEILQSKARPCSVCLVEFDCKLAERQFECASFGWGVDIIARLRGLSERLIIDIRRPSQSRVYSPWRGAMLAGEKERVSVHDSGEIIGSIAAF